MQETVQSTKARNRPFKDIVALAEDWASKGAVVYQKWTCGLCGERITADAPNTFTTEGLHTEREDGQHCGHITNLEADGCGLVVVLAPERNLNGRESESSS